MQSVYLSRVMGLQWPWSWSRFGGSGVAPFAGAVILSGPWMWLCGHEPNTIWSTRRGER
jgi:hypothetical protein